MQSPPAGAHSGLEVFNPTPRALPGESDESLVSLLQSGNLEAWGTLFSRYAGLIQVLAWRILRDNNEADDLVQDMFLFLQRKSMLFDNSKGSARSWIIQMTYHRAIERRRYLPEPSDEVVTWSSSSAHV